MADGTIDTIYRDSASRLGMYDMIAQDGSRGAYRPIARGTHGAVTSGHMLATMAGHDVLRAGGNAFDAGVAAGLCLCVVEHDRVSLGGVAPIIVYDARDGKVTTISGLGRWPKAASLDYFREHYGGEFKPGMGTTITPAAMDAWLLCLKKFGTLRFEEVVAQALLYAEKGFPVSEVLREDIIEYYDGFKDWPTNAAIFAPDGKIPDVGDLIRQPALANSLRRFIAVEREAGAAGRAEGLDAIRRYFYEGPVAERLVAFCQEHGGLLTMEDMTSFSVRCEAPVKLGFGEFELYTCDTWTQGPALLATLALLKGFDLKALGHNSVAYIHTIAEAIKLAFADRDAYYGDPDFVSVPLDELLSEAYCRERRELIDPDRAWPTMPPCGEVAGARPYFGRTPPHEEAPAVGVQAAPDTTVASVIDGEGNIFCTAPSDPCLRHIMDSELGFGLSPRGTQSWLHPNHPSVLAPGKRPRLTTNPVLVLRDGRPWMALCTPGGDVQPQAMLQVFLNIAVFGMNAQQATEMPRFTSFSFPASFYPHRMRPGALAVEERVGDPVLEGLASKGHKIKRWPAWSGDVGGACVIVRDPNTGLLHGGADPRRDACATAW